MEKSVLKNISLEEMLKLEIADLLSGYPSGGRTYYFKDGDGTYSEIITFDLFRGRFTTDNGDFSEFEWELKESHIYIEV
jgi:hypothetical protein